MNTSVPSVPSVVNLNSTSPIHALATLERVRRDVSHLRRRANDGYVENKLSGIEHDVRNVLCYLNEFILAVPGTDSHPSLAFYEMAH